MKGVVLLLSAGAYWIAIIVKEIIELASLGPLESAYGYQSIEVALFLGGLTVFLEVGLAYLFALYGFRRNGLQVSDAVTYGLGLSFWENGVLLGVLSLFNLLVVYLLLLSPSSIATTVYQDLSSASPNLFLPPASLLPGVLLGTLERVSSMLAHIAWGILVVLAAVTGKMRYLAYALPMGLVDALVPFASDHIYLFEGGVFLLSLGFIFVARKSLSDERAGPAAGQTQTPPSA
jgi:hypothetical protein